METLQCPTRPAPKPLLNRTHEKSGDSGASAPTRLLILGGTREARDLAALVAGLPDVEAILSLAGRTSMPLETALPTRMGGFGGVSGLIQFLVDNRISRVIDATHPFASQISENARQACATLGLPLLVLSRPTWRREEGDLWIEAADNASAARALGEAPRRVFLTIGRLGVAAFRAAPQHCYLVRSIEPPEPAELPPHAEVVLARGPFALEEEIALLRARRIDVVVSKNSGGPLTYAKIAAARTLGLPVVMVAPPTGARARPLESLDAAVAFARGAAPA